MIAIHAHHRNLVTSAGRDALEGKRPYDPEFRIVLPHLPHGEERGLHNRVEIQRDENGQPIRTRGKALDLADRKKAERAGDRILEMTHHLVCVAGMDGYFKYAIPSWERLLGYPPEELLSRPFQDFIRSEDRHLLQ